MLYDLTSDQEFFRDTTARFLDDRTHPRRSALAQSRSRNTRRRLIRAALEIWGERGFEDAFEDATAEDIARAAGVSKGTFYFHFAHKEDILLEMPWATVEIMTEEAERAMRRGEPTGELVEQVMVSLGRRVSRAPRTAVLRVTGHWSRLSHSGTVPETPRGFGQVFHTVLQTPATGGSCRRRPTSTSSRRCSRP